MLASVSIRLPTSSSLFQPELWPAQIGHGKLYPLSAGAAAGNTISCQVLTATPEATPPVSHHVHLPLVLRSCNPRRKEKKP